MQTSRFPARDALPFSQLRRAFTPWGVTAVFTLFYIVMILVGRNWDPMYFVNIGGQFDPRVNNNAYGYDGQFVYQIARDPLNASPYLDTPAYRYQRILYPILARVLSFGNLQILPWVLIMINFATLVGGTKVTEIFLEENGQSRWYALTYGLFVGLQIAVRLDLTEPLAFLLVQLAALSFQRNRLWTACLFFVLASLTRELALTFAFAAFLTLFFRKRYTFSLLWGTITILPFLIWEIVLRLWLGEWGIHSGGAFATPFEILPFRGLWSIAGQVDPQIFLAMALVVAPLVLVPALISIFIATRALMQGKKNFGSWSLLVNALLFPFLPQSNIMAVSGLVRVAVGLVTAVLQYGAMNRSKRALNYSLLWMIALIFLYGDSFVGKIN